MRFTTVVLALVCLVLAAGCQSAGGGAADLTLPHDGGAADLIAPPVGNPSRLSETGLFSDIATRALAPGVFEYTPRFPTWTDGTAGDSYLLLPAGGRIDTSDMDRWVFPVGTKSWRDVRVGNLLVETRYLEKKREGAGGWFEMSYAWSADHGDALASPDGATHVLGTTYNVLASYQCSICHDNVRDTLIGASAVQLSRASGTSPLSQLVAMGRLTSPPAAEFQVPGTPLEQSALAYLHANCGHCHASDSLLRKTLAMNLDLRVTDKTAAATAAYRTAINAKMFHPQPPDIIYCVVPGHPEKSQLWTRIGVRDDWAMPNLDTDVVDAAGVALISDWINALPP